MALTNFAALTPQQKLVWSRDLWKEARDRAFITKFVGTDENSVIQRITELTRTEKGEQVIMHLLSDLVDDGIVGDNEREGNEEQMMTYTDIITIDLISHGVRQKGKLADQKTVVRFRENARDRLAYWLANRMDQLALLTLSGVGYGNNLDGSTRTSAAFSQLAFASDVRAPSTNRHVRITNDGAGGYGGLDSGNTAADDMHTMSYKALVDIGVHAKTHYVKPLMAGGKEYYVVFVRPETLAQLKKDSDYINAIVNAREAGEGNPFFTGGTVTVDGLILHEHRLVYNTKGAASGSKWGSSGNTDGTRTLLCGSQALGMADLGSPEWAEKLFQYDSSPGINVDKMFGLLKPKFHSIYDESEEDFGVVAIDHLV
jgi:N4-gp56 family major capsid protein